MSREAARFARTQAWAEMMAAREAEDRAALLAMLPVETRARLAWEWSWWERPEQSAPPPPWRTWLVMAGRGWGKTRVGAEWVRAAAERHGRLRIALVGATGLDARRVMVEGESGLLEIAPPDRRPRWEPSLGKLTWPSGAQGFVYSAAEPDSLRGPTHHIAWADEIAKWGAGEAAWDNLAMTLRAGTHPRVVATTTPRPVPLVRRLAADPAVAITRGSTGRNRANLSGSFLAGVAADYAGTRLARQELEGELIEEAAGALWRRDLLERCRTAPATLADRADGRWRRVVVGVDPPASAEGDACGIVAAVLLEGERALVLEDATLAGASPERWARAVADCAARWGADRVVAEGNQGGDMVTACLRAADATMPLQLVHATRGKSARAEPVAALYEKGKVRHAGLFPELEDQLCGMTVGGGYQGPGRSPDRADALVWALTALLLGKRSAVAVRGL